MTNENTERLLTPHQVAQLFRVDPKTVARWASNGWIGSIRTPGGHRRFRESEITALLAERTMPAPPRRPPDRITTPGMIARRQVPMDTDAARVPHRRDPSPRPRPQR